MDNIRKHTRELKDLRDNVSEEEFLTRVAVRRASYESEIAQLKQQIERARIRNERRSAYVWSLTLNLDPGMVRHIFQHHITDNTAHLIGLEDREEFKYWDRFRIFIVDHGFENLLERMGKE